MNLQEENIGKINPCMWCCFPCLFTWTITEKCLQSCCICVCQIMVCDFKETSTKKNNNIEPL